LTGELNAIKTSKISFIIFGISLVVVGLFLITLIFPSFIVLQFLNQDGGLVEGDPFTLGVLTGPFLVVNLILLVIGILYHKNKLPSPIKNSIKFILKFEISKKVATISFLVLIFGYIAFTVQDLAVYEGDEWLDYKLRIEPYLEEYPYGEAVAITAISHVKNFLLYTSLTLLQNVKIIPYLATLALFLMTYLLTVKISEKRFAGLIAMMILMQSPTFLRYDTLAVYSNFWTLFYVLSLYLIYNKWYISTAAFILSIFSKPLSVIFLPLTLFFIYRSDLSNRKKILLGLSYIAILVGIVTLILSGVKIPGRSLSFDAFDFWVGITSWAVLLRLDLLILILLLPVIVGLFLAARNGIKQADVVLILIIGTLLSGTIMAAFTDFNINPYRYVPFIVFFAIGVGVLLSRKIIERV